MCPSVSVEMALFLPRLRVVSPSAFPSVLLTSGVSREHPSQVRAGRDVCVLTFEFCDARRFERHPVCVKHKACLSLMCYTCFSKICALSGVGFPHGTLTLFSVQLGRPPRSGRSWHVVGGVRASLGGAGRADLGGQEGGSGGRLGPPGGLSPAGWGWGARRSCPWPLPGNACRGGTAWGRPFWLFSTKQDIPSSNRDDAVCL